MTAPGKTSFTARTAARCLSLVIVVIGPAACSTTAAPADAGSSAVSCLPESGGRQYRVDTYGPHLKKSGETGTLSFELVSSEPGPPVQGKNTFIVKIARVDGAPFAGTLYIDPYNGVFMPLHGHGASDQPAITFDSTTGVYTLTPMDLFMPGLWRITLQGFETTASPEAGSPDGAAIDAGASLVDTGVFYFCIE